LLTQRRLRTFKRPTCRRSGLTRAGARIDNAFPGDRQRFTAVASREFQILKVQQLDGTTARLDEAGALQT